LFKSELEKFVARRIALFFLIGAVISVIFFADRWLIILGLLVGGGLSTGRFASYAWSFRKNTSGQEMNIGKAVMRGLLTFVGNQLILIPLLFVAYRFHQSFFVSMIVGVLMAPIVLMVNSFTEAMGVTRNCFYM
jgi:hypothetical protein